MGKSTLARYLEEHFGFLRIPEVNELFRETRREGPTWYFDRQLDRYGLAASAGRAGRSAVLDGDPFQPLWYNWIYPEFGPVADAVRYYSNSIADARIAFPDCYVVLAAPPKALKDRKDGDDTRRRSNFERHLKMIEAQRRYFTALRDKAHGTVRFLDNIRIEETAERIAGLTDRSSVRSADALSLISDWLSAQPAVRPE